MYLWTEDAVSPARQARSSVALFAAGIVFAVAALSATGQTLQIRFDGAPSVLEAGRAFQAEVQVARAGEPVGDVQPEIVFTDAAGVRHSYAARPDVKRGIYRVMIQLPDGGRWTYEVRVGDHVYRRGEIAAKPPLAAG